MDVRFRNEAGGELFEVVLQYRFDNTERHKLGGNCRFKDVPVLFISYNFIPAKLQLFFFISDFRPHFLTLF